MSHEDSTKLDEQAASAEQAQVAIRVLMREIRLGHGEKIPEMIRAEDYAALVRASSCLEIAALDWKTRAAKVRADLEDGERKKAAQLELRKNSTGG